MTRQATEAHQRAAAREPLAEPPVTESSTGHRASSRGLAALQRAVGNRTVTALLDRATGVPLDALTQQEMETRFGHSFGDVRIHTDSDAAHSSWEMHAAAYTIGRDIAFAAGRYDPHSAIGRRLLAHELAHVVQQDHGPSGESNPAGLEASAQGAATAAGERAGPIAVAGSSGPAVACADETASQVSSSPPEASKGPPRAAPVPTVEGRAESRRLVDAMADLKSIQPSSVASGVYDMVIAGKHQQVPKAKVDEAYKKIAKELRSALASVVSKAERALDSYNNQTAINKDQWIVSGVIEFFGRVKDPGPELISQGSTATILAAEGMAAIERGDFVTAAIRLADAEAYASRAQMMFTAYWEHLISVAEMTVTVLEWTEKTAFVTLAILATIASGGAALGVIGAEGVTVAGVTTTASMVGTANLISFAAPTLAHILQSGTKAALGEDVDWGQVGVETIVDIVLYKLGGKLGEGLLGRFAKLPAFQTLGRQALAGVLSNVMIHEGSAAFRTTVMAIYERLRHGKTTWDEFGNELIAALTNPEGLFFAVVNGASMGVGHGRATGVGRKRQAQQPSPKPPAAATAAAPAAGPAVETPATGTDIKAPAPQPPVTQAAPQTQPGETPTPAPASVSPTTTGEPAAPPTPQTPGPQQQVAAGEAPTSTPGTAIENAPAAAAPAALEGAPPVKTTAQTTDELFAEINAEQSQPSQEPKGPGAPKKPVEPHIVTPEEANRVKAMQGERADARRDMVDTSFKNEPADLQTAVKSTKPDLPGGMSMEDLAADSPQLVKELYQKWKDGQAAETIKSDTTFPEYVAKRQAEFRGRFGEFEEAFERGRSRVVVFAPKARTTEGGLDVISYEPSSKRIEIIDRKEFEPGSPVTKVSALQENFSKGLAKAIAQIQAYVNDPKISAPSEIGSDVLPRLRGAKADIDAYTTKTFGNSPTEAQLKSTPYQKAITQILNQYGIDRFVTGAPMGGTLPEKGFLP